MSLLARDSLHTFWELTALLLNKCGMGEKEEGDQKRVLLCYWLILHYSTQLH